MLSPDKIWVSEGAINLTVCCTALDGVAQGTIQPALDFAYSYLLLVIISRLASSPKERLKYAMEKITRRSSLITEQVLIPILLVS
jgi:hypothetical protein